MRCYSILILRQETNRLERAERETTMIITKQYADRLIRRGDTGSA